MLILTPMNGEECSYYIHVPFCTKKCGYCHFFVLPYREGSVALYLNALKKEIALYQPLKKPLTIYFGGGTPSLLTPQQIAEILSWIPHDKGIEITLECNPENVEDLQEFAAIGINRVSMGVQSLDDSQLQTLTRRHDAQKAIHAIHASRDAGITNISIDLMYDIPSQTKTSWRHTLKQVGDLPITHLSLYNLTFEPHTSFYKKKDSFMLPDSQTSLELLEEAIHSLESFGLHRYEISAFAKPGFESKHNTGYWTGRPFLGFGPSAFSYIDGKRKRNVANLNKYVQALNNDQFPLDFEEELKPGARLKELLAIRLRLLSGCTIPSPLPQETHTSITKLLSQGLLQLQENTLSLTHKGTLFYDTVAEELIEI